MKISDKIEMYTVITEIVIIMIILATAVFIISDLQEKEIERSGAFKNSFIAAKEYAEIKYNKY